MNSFRKGGLRLLVATDVAARGIDVENIDAVVNYDIPQDEEDYVHRIGRTGRAGNEGEATALVCIDELKLWASIEKLTKATIPLQEVAGFEVDPSIPAKPIVNGGTQGHRAQGGRQQPQPNQKQAMPSPNKPHAEAVKPKRPRQPQQRRSSHQ
jgi:ATP-dependent RNA helicase RhlE